MALSKDEILKRMLDRVPSRFDKREGSVIHDALAPVAYELEQVLLDYEEKLRNTFAGTADRDGLIKRCAEIGIEPLEATRSVRKAQFTPSSVNVNIGERFNFEDLNFIVIEKIEPGIYSVQCESYGTIGNYGSGQLIPINYIQGLETATLLDDVVIYGEDEEETEELRSRYFATLPTMTLDGNIAQYSKWCREFSGIGNFKIFPCWDGVNTVKVSILATDNSLASEKLIAEFQEYLDPDKEGLGMGKAPIGATVTVSTANIKNIDVTCKVMLEEGYTEPYKLSEKISEYLQSYNYKRDFVSSVGINAIVDNCEGVDVVIEVKVNGSNENVTLGDEEIARLNSLSVVVV